MTESPDPAPAGLTVVIATRDRRSELSRTLDRLSELPERPPVIVVDNGSSDGTAAMVRPRHPDVVLLAARTNLGAVARKQPATPRSTLRCDLCQPDA